MIARHVASSPHQTWTSGHGTAPSSGGRKPPIDPDHRIEPPVVAQSARPRSGHGIGEDRRSARPRPTAAPPASAHHEALWFAGQVIDFRRSPTIAAADRSAPTATGSRRPPRWPRPAAPPRSGAVPGSAAPRLDAVAARPGHGPSPPPRSRPLAAPSPRSARSSTRRVVPGGIGEATGRASTPTLATAVRQRRCHAATGHGWPLAARRGPRDRRGLPRAACPRPVADDRHRAACGPTAGGARPAS